MDTVITITTTIIITITITIMESAAGLPAVAAARLPRVPRRDRADSKPSYRPHRPASSTPPSLLLPSAPVRPQIQIRRPPPRPQQLSQLRRQPLRLQSPPTRTTRITRNLSTLTAVSSTSCRAKQNHHPVAVNLFS